MAGVRYIVSCLMMLLLVGANGQDVCNEEPDVDPIEMLQDGIISTESIDIDGVTETTVNRMMDEQLEENPAIREITAAIAEEQASSPDDPIGSVTGLEGQTSDLQLNIKINTHLKAYYQTCPYRAWWLLRGQYYFFNSLADGTKEYYWAYYHWWYVSCGQKYCDVSFKLPWFWFHYHRCFPEYRRVWFWALCLTVQPSGAQTWTSKLIFRTVPRGCCCRRYWKALTVLQCPVGTTG